MLYFSGIIACIFFASYPFLREAHEKYEHITSDEPATPFPVVEMICGKGNKKVPKRL